MNSMPLNPLSQATEGQEGPRGVGVAIVPSLTSPAAQVVCYAGFGALKVLFQKEDRKINYDYCKGCGLCVKECPVQAITMIKEVDND